MQYWLLRDQEIITDNNEEKKKKITIKNMRG